MTVGCCLDAGWRLRGSHLWITLNKHILNDVWAQFWEQERAPLSDPVPLPAACLRVLNPLREDHHSLRAFINRNCRCIQDWASWPHQEWSPNQLLPQNNVTQTHTHTHCVTRSQFMFAIRTHTHNSAWSSLHLHKLACITVCSCTHFAKVAKDLGVWPGKVQKLVLRYIAFYVDILSMCDCSIIRTCVRYVEHRFIDLPALGSKLSRASQLTYDQFPLRYISSSGVQHMGSAQSGIGFVVIFHGTCSFMTA